MAQAGAKRVRPVKNGVKSEKRRRIDDLAWKSVDTPENLEDYEGFFGLEEVEDVDVVRDEVTGVLRFHSRDGAAARSDKRPTRETASDGERGDDVDEDDEEWAGFGDEEEQSSPHRSDHDRKKTKTASPQVNGAFNALAQEQELNEADVLEWRPLGISADVLSALSRLNFSSPTAIQRAAIPDILAGHDVIGKASTGSGKTLAFGIPIVEEFLERRPTFSKGERKLPLALILSPTRELAHQLEKHMRALCSQGTFDGPSIATLTGGLSLQKQQRLLKNADIIIGTPGRLWEVISESKGTNNFLRSIQFLVIDEADRLLSEGHFKEVEEILNSLDRKDTDDQEDGNVTQEETKSLSRQTLVFSATFDRNLQRKLSAKAKPSSLDANEQSLEYLLKKLKFREDKPKFIDVNSKSQLASNLKEGLVQCSGMEKDLYLYTLLLLKKNARTLVFTNSIDAVKRLTPFLQNLNLPALPLHSGMPQKARLRSIERFTAQQPNNNNKDHGSILIATDVAARGLDIPQVQLIIHYHLPREADTYVHRSGRTARAGNSGSSIIICAPEEAAGVRRLVAKVHAHTTPDDDAAKQGFYIRTLQVDRTLVSRLKPRVTLAKTIADTQVAKTKGKKEDDTFGAWAEELGVDLDSEDDFKGKRGRGRGREKREKELRELSKREVGAMKAVLKGLLGKRVNAGVSEKYLAGSGTDGGDAGDFLGSVQDIGL